MTLTAARSGNLRSIYAMLIAVAMFSLMDMAMKLLSAHYPAMQVAALRALRVAAAGAAPTSPGAAASRTMLRVRWPLHLLRGALGIAMLALFAFGLQDAVAGRGLFDLLHRAGPDHRAVGAVPERARQRCARWIAIAVGMAGVLVVLRPTGDRLASPWAAWRCWARPRCYAMSAIAGAHPGAHRQQRAAWCSG